MTADAVMPAVARSPVMRALASVSLANLCMVYVWSALFHSPDYLYYTTGLVRSRDSLAALLGVGLLGLLLFGLCTAIERSHGWWKILCVLALIAILAVPANFLRLRFGILPFHAAGTQVAAGLAALALGVGAAIAPGRIYRGVSLFLVIFSPYCAVTLGSAGWQMAQSRGEPPRAATLAPANAPADRPTTRLVFVLFDGWDTKPTFEARPVDLQLPQIDALARTSVQAVEAYPPAAYTKMSIPAMLAGRMIAEVSALPDAQLLVRWDPEGPWTDFAEGGHLLRDLASVGVNTAVYGWFHPYGRMFGRLAGCTVRSWPLPWNQGFGGETLGGSVAGQLGYVATFGNRRILARRVYDELHASAKAAVADPRIGFVFLHYSVPHTPAVFNRHTGRFPLLPVPPVEGYLSNLALVDRTIGELFDAAGSAQGKSTAWIFTSDHWWRSISPDEGEAGHPVPLLIRFPGQTSVVRIDTPVCTTILRQLARQIVLGELRTPESIRAVLAANRLAVPMKYRPVLGGVAEP